MTIFLDTSFLIPFYNDKDMNHKKSLKLIEIIKNNEYGKIFTSYEVLDELLTYIQRKVSKSLCTELAKYWIVDRLGFAEFILLDEYELNQAAELLIKQENERKPLSFTDCTIVVACRKTDIPNVATYDAQFSSFLTVLPNET